MATVSTYRTSCLLPCAFCLSYPSYLLDRFSGPLTVPREFLPDSRFDEVRGRGFESSARTVAGPFLFKEPTHSLGTRHLGGVRDFANVLKFVAEHGESFIAEQRRVELDAHDAKAAAPCEKVCDTAP